MLLNAEGNKITVAGAGGVQLKIFPRVLANKVGYLLAICKNRGFNVVSSSNDYFALHHNSFSGKTNLAMMTTFQIIITNNILRDKVATFNNNQ